MRLRLDRVVSVNPLDRSIARQESFNLSERAATPSQLSRSSAVGSNRQTWKDDRCLGTLGCARLDDNVEESNWQFNLPSRFALAPSVVSYFAKSFHCCIRFQLTFGSLASTECQLVCWCIFFSHGKGNITEPKESCPKQFDSGVNLALL